jgi:hypothetical protein
MRFGFYVRTDGFGNIVALHRNRGQCPHPSFDSELQDPDEILAVQREPWRFRFDRGRLVRKPELVLALEDPRPIAGDGQDVARIHVIGAPEGVEKVRVRVGTNEVLVPVDEPLEISASLAGTVRVRLEEPLLHAEPVIVSVVEA